MLERNTSYYGIVVLLDRLGTKGIWKNRDTKEVLKEYEQFLEMFRKAVSGSKKGTEQLKQALGIEVEYEVNAFSDTIIMTCAVPKSQEKETWAPGLIGLVGAFLQPIIAFSIFSNIYFRGAISLGSFYRTESIIIGPAIDEAAQYYMLPEWIGVSASPSVHYLLSNHSGEPDPREFFAKHDIPLKIGYEKNGWAINWPTKEHAEGQEQELVDALFNKIKAVMAKEVQTVDVNIALKWRNTIDFFNAYHN